MQVSSSPPQASPVSLTPPPRRRGLYITLIVLLIILLIGAGVVASFFLLTSTGQPQKTIVGHAFFVSSGQIKQFSDLGIADEIQVTLQNLPPPQPGKRYFVWLLSENPSDTSSLSIGQVSADQSQANIFYRNPDNSDLLVRYSRLLVTEEDADLTPANPSFDTSTWRYYAAFSNIGNPTDVPNHYSLLAHLRHLLAQDPKLAKVGLGGGLDIWLYRNISKILEWAGSARDTQQTCQASGCAQYIQRQITRILDYLDGPYSWQEQIPLNIQGNQLLVDSTIARVALLELDTVNQEPPGYLKHIGVHLQGITQSPGVTQRQRTLALQINQAINNLQSWLDAMHRDAQQLIHMSIAQLLQKDTATILNHLYTQANYAFVGQTDPNTNSTKDGAVQIHYDIQQLATFDVASCVLNSDKSSCIGV